MEKPKDNRFKDKEVKKLANGEITLKYQKIKKVGYKKLQILLNNLSILFLF